MPLLIEKHKHRRFPLSYEQGRTAVFALAHFIGAAAYSKDPQAAALRKEAQALLEALRAYNWSTGWPS